jgi:hypothetical protein
MVGAVRGAVTPTVSWGPSRTKRPENGRPPVAWGRCRTTRPRSPCTTCTSISPGPSRASLIPIPGPGDGSGTARSRLDVSGDRGSAGLTNAACSHGGVASARASMACGPRYWPRGSKSPDRGPAWRAGRLSDRALALLVLIRFPIISVFGAIMVGGSLPFIAFIAVISLLPGLFLYRFLLAFIQKQATERRPN